MMGKEWDTFVRSDRPILTTKGNQTIAFLYELAYPRIDDSLHKVPIRLSLVTLKPPETSYLGIHGLSPAGIG